MNTGTLGVLLLASAMVVGCQGRPSVHGAKDSGAPAGRPTELTAPVVRSPDHPPRADAPSAAPGSATRGTAGAERPAADAVKPAEVNAETDNPELAAFVQKQLRGFNERVWDAIGATAEERDRAWTVAQAEHDKLRLLDDQELAGQISKEDGAKAFAEVEAWTAQQYEAIFGKDRAAQRDKEEKRLMLELPEAQRKSLE